MARRAILTELDRGVACDNKASDGFDPVTEADRAAERALRALIEERFPDHGIWGEEFGMVRAEAPIRWSLDPVDGTRALICGLPSWAVLVGLLENGRHIDLVIENGLKPHDHDAPVAVVQGAGGHIGDWEGGEDFTPGRVVAAATRELYEGAVELLCGLAAMG